MKKTKLTLSIALAMICTTATMGAYARTSIFEIKNQVAALENTMPTKADQTYVCSGQVKLATILEVFQ
jgi:hypothetical protein